MQIKTVYTDFDHSTIFDDEVNALLEEGWELARRDVLPGLRYNDKLWASRMLYAELVKPDTPEAPPEPAPLGAYPSEELIALEALHVIKATCKGAEVCRPDTCPLWDWCQKYLPEAYAAPAHWELPGEAAKQ